jgi:tetratricopeptide (TPR) repeat protein
MSQQPIGDSSLTRDALFRMFAEEACRDGILEDFEKSLLLNVAKFLRLENHEAQRILLEAKEKYEQGLLGEQRPLEPRALYLRAVSAVYEDGQVDPIEEKMLAGLRKMFEIYDEEHQSFLRGLPSAIRPSDATSGSIEKSLPEAVPIEADRQSMSTTSPAIEKKAVQPGLHTMHLAERLENNLQAAWFKEHCSWYEPIRQATPEAKSAWRRFLNGLLNLNEQEAYRGLDELDDILQPMNSVSYADIFTALAAIRWSRVLLKTEFSMDESAEIRSWPGRDLYSRLAVKMVPILISIDYYRVNEGLDEYGGLAFVYLLEDLCMLVERRHAEPLVELGKMLKMLFRAVQKSKVTHQAADLIAPLTAEVFRQGGVMQEHFVVFCQTLCEVEPKNHPLVVAADRAIRTIAPERSIFPKDYKPSDSVPSSKPGYPTAVERLEKLIARVVKRQETERLFISGLSGVDLSEIDSIKLDLTRACHEDRINPALIMEGYLVAMVLPNLKDYPRPVVAFFALGEGGSHHEELKGSWVKVLLKSHPDGALQVIPDFPISKNTDFLSIKLSFDGVSELKAALDRTMGAYDVALVDPDRKGARLWHQTGDLDATGNLFLVERQLLRENKEDEALAALDSALKSQPWLSIALLHKGLIVKRKGDLAGARGFFESALAVQPHDPQAMARIGVLEKNENKLDESDKILLESLKIFPTLNRPLPLIVS